ncbi:ArsI/CadI family heavy metal resistance metalloenzyme [Actinokineospora sp. HUAS TT18]|uniref:ArsI/CadI family heavy metal resistance metalloenzyme n=1 Tax=Actinokineospora sp. HUAS TT18 TaxID=3447451 RepID=UPI003F521042
MSRVQLALRVPDLEAAVDFYSKLLGTVPAKSHEGYANFAVTEPPLKLILLQGEASDATALDHLGVEVETSEEVHAATARLREAGLSTQHEESTSCCYAVQDKVWTEGPGREPWEIYVVKQDADKLTHDNGVCCAPASDGSGATAKTTLATATAGLAVVPQAQSCCG